MGDFMLSQMDDADRAGYDYSLEDEPDLLTKARALVAAAEGSRSHEGCTRAAAAAPCQVCEAADDAYDALANVQDATWPELLVAAAKSHADTPPHDCATWPMDDQMLTCAALAHVAEELPANG